MLTYFKIDNFKSLTNFELPRAGESRLGKLVFLVGLNGAGKTSVLQAIDLLAHLVAGDFDDWLRQRGWERGDLLRKRSKKKTISFEVRFEFEYAGIFEWEGIFNPYQGRCTEESLTFTPNVAYIERQKKLHGASVFPEGPVKIRLERNVLSDSSGAVVHLTNEVAGSVFRSLRISQIGFPGNAAGVVYFLRFFLREVKSLELLSPNQMRKPSKSGIDVGKGGENLASFFHGLSASEKLRVNTELAKFYPNHSSLQSKAGKYGWKRLLVGEQFDDLLEVEARHMSDGFLRIAALVAQTVAVSGFDKTRASVGEAELGNLDQAGYNLILLDEVENGVNPEIVERLITYLRNVRQQVIVTTHSPLVLNYLPEEVAKDSVFFVFRDESGASGATRLFNIPKVRKKLEVMGPGEAFLDLRLQDICSELCEELSVAVRGGDEP